MNEKRLVENQVPSNLITEAELAAELIQVGQVDTVSGGPGINVAGTVTDPIVSADFGTAAGKTAEGDDSRFHSNALDHSNTNDPTPDEKAALGATTTSLNAGNPPLVAADLVGVNTDESAKVSANDTTAGYLNGKLIAGSNISFLENNDGFNETLTISAAGGATDDKDILISANDTTPGYLDTKLVAGSNITLTENNDGGNETLTIAAAAGATDDKDILISANDTTSGFLDTKLVQGTGITLTENNDGFNETLTIASTITNTDETSKVSVNDTTPGFLNGKLIAGSNITLLENNDGANETLTISATGGATDDKDVLISANDTTSGYLDTKLVAGTGITLTENNDGGNETLTVASTITNTDESAKVSVNDTTPGFLNGKLVAGTDITLTEVNDGANETLSIAYTGTAGQVNSIGPGIATTVSGTASIPIVDVTLGTGAGQAAEGNHTHPASPINPEMVRLVATGITTDVAIGATSATTVLAIAYDPNGGVLYASDGATTANHDLRTVNTSTGASAVVGATGFGKVDSLTYDSINDILYGVSRTSFDLISINVSTGAGLAIGSTGNGEIRALEFNSDNSTMYAVDYVTSKIYTVNTSTGVLTEIATADITGLISLAYNPLDKKMYTYVFVSTWELRTLDVTTGVTTYIRDIVLGGYELGYDAANNIMYGTENFTDILYEVGIAEDFDLSPASYTQDGKHIMVFSNGKLLDLANTDYFEITTTDVRVGATLTGDVLMFWIFG